MKSETRYPPGRRVWRVQEAHGLVYRTRPTTEKQPMPPGRLDVSNGPVFERLLGDLAAVVVLLREDVSVQRARATGFAETFRGWQAGRPGANATEDVFLLETLYASLANLLLNRVGRDKGVPCAKPPLDGYAWYRPDHRLQQDVEQRLAAYEFSRLDRDILGKLYEKCLPSAERKALGLFTTPEAVVDRILEAVGYTPDEPIEDKTLLDPACGPGAFLVRATRALVARCRSLGYSAADTLTQVSANVYGLDIAPFAVYLARVNVLIQLLDLIHQAARERPGYCFPGPNVSVADALGVERASLFYPLSDGERGGLAEDIRQRRGRFRYGLDFVVGNPPYGKAHHLTTEQRAYFAPSTYGHANYYGLFLQLGIDLLTPGGKLGYIVPSSMTSGLYFKDLRAYIADRTAVRWVINVSPRKEVFDDVLQGVMILALERMGRGQPRPDTVSVSRVSSAQELGRPIANWVQIPTDSALLKKGGSLYFVFCADERAYRIIDRFFARGHPLSSAHIGYKARTGPIVWNRVKEYLRDTPDADCRPLLWSNNVSRYGFIANGNRFGGSGWAVAGPKTASLKTTGAAILVQRTTAREQPRRLIAAYPRGFFARYPAYFIENHLNYITPVRTDTDIQPEYILALLNSALYDFVFRRVNGNTQVSASELDSFPVAPDADQDAFRGKVDRLATGLSEDQRLSVEREIDEMVFDLFGLDRSDRDFVLRGYARG